MTNDSTPLFEQAADEDNGQLVSDLTPSLEEDIPEDVDLENDRARAFEDAARKDFNLFVELCFQHVSSNDEYKPNWHIDAICHHLERARMGHSTRVMVCMPPRYGKSIVASIAWPAWLLGHNPRARVVCGSYASGLAIKFASDCRSFMNSPIYKRLFPETVISNVRSAVHDFETTKGGGRFATSTDGTLTGRGGDYIILDDPLKPLDAMSEAERRRVINWYRNTTYTRLNNKLTGCIVLIQQRLHEDDLAGYLLNLGGWDLLSLPAIAVNDERIPVAPGIFHHRKVGDLLHPAHEPLEKINEARRQLGTADFNAQYQQAPVPEDGQVFRRAWFKYYLPHERPERFSVKVISIDSACKTGEDNDYTAVTIWGLADRAIFLLDVIRERLEFGDLLKLVQRVAREHPDATILVEDKASGTQLIQILGQLGVSGVTSPSKLNDGDKIMRAFAQAPLFEDGTVRMPAEALWLDDYQHELLGFPRAKHDDQVDSTSQALAWLREAMAVEDYSNLDIGQCLNPRGRFRTRFDYDY